MEEKIPLSIFAYAVDDYEIIKYIKPGKENMSYMLFTGIHNKRFMGTVVRSNSLLLRGQPAKRSCIRRFDVHSNTCTVTLHRHSCTIHF